MQIASKTRTLLNAVLEVAKINLQGSRCNIFNNSKEKAILRYLVFLEKICGEKLILR